MNTFKKPASITIGGKEIVFDRASKSQIAIGAMFCIIAAFVAITFVLFVYWCIFVP